MRCPWATGRFPLVCCPWATDPSPLADSTRALCAVLHEPVGTKPVRGSRRQMLSTRKRYSTNRGHLWSARSCRQAESREKTVNLDERAPPHRNSLVSVWRARSRNYGALPDRYRHRDPESRRFPRVTSLQYLPQLSLLMDCPDRCCYRFIADLDTAGDPERLANRVRACPIRGVRPTYGSRTRRQSRRAGVDGASTASWPA